MCNPIAFAAVALAMSAASTAASMKSQHDSAEAQMEVEQKNMLEQTKAAQKVYGMQVDQLNQQEREINQQAAAEQEQLNRNIRAEQARLRVASGEAGIGGVLAMKLQQNQDMIQSLDAATIESNRSNKIGQAEYEKKMEREKATGPKLYQASPGVNYLAAGLKIGSDTLAAYGTAKAAYAKPSAGGGGADVASGASQGRAR